MDMETGYELLDMNFWIVVSGTALPKPARRDGWSGNDGVVQMLQIA
jgi:hypothetical protein